MTTFEPLTPERRRAMTRQHLLEAAAMVFARDGFQGSSLDHIAATAGFTKGAVYSNFKNKDDLFLAVLEDHFERQHQAMKRALEPGTHSPEVWMPRIASAVREAMWDDNWAMLFLEFVLYAARNPQARSKLADWMRRSQRRVEQLIAQEHDAAGASPRYPPADLAIISGALFEGLGLYRLIDPSFTNDHILGSVLEFMSDAIGIEQDSTKSGPSPEASHGRAITRTQNNESGTDPTSTDRHFRV